MGGIKIWHIVVLIIAFVLLFGWKNLPNVARSMGESMRVFKSEVDQMKDENAARNAEKNAPSLGDGSATPAAGPVVERPVDRVEDTAQREYRESVERRPDDRV